MAERPLQKCSREPDHHQFEDYDFGGEGVGYHTTSSLADSGYRDGEGIALNVSNINSAADEGYTSYLRNAGDSTNYTMSRRLYVRIRSSCGVAK